MASPALAAMNQPGTGTRETSTRLSGPSRRKPVESGVCSSTVTVQSASTPGFEAIVVIGMREPSTMRWPHSVSSETTPRRARSGSKNAALASKYSSKSA